MAVQKQLDSTPPQIGAPGIWGASLDTAGQGIKVGIIDSGVDPEHPFFDPSGYTMPPGFPKGQRQFTTAKVIVARSFPPSGSSATMSRLAFDPDESPHGTHVAGIAAGNPGTPADGRSVSGVAPRAYIGNYRVFNVPDPLGGCCSANTPEIVAAFEAAVRDGMDVINFSGGGPQADPRTDGLVPSVANVVKAGVVAVISAGNDRDFFGLGTTGSPATAPDAIAVGATTKSAG